MANKYMARQDNVIPYPAKGKFNFKNFDVHRKLYVEG